MNCETCEAPVDNNTLNCNGICGKSFHISCLSSANGNYKGALVGYLRKIPNLRWFCDSCSAETYVTTEVLKKLADLKCFADKFLTTFTSNDLTTHLNNDGPTPKQPTTDKTSDTAHLNGSFSTATSEIEHMDDHESSPSKSTPPNAINSGASTSALNSMVTNRKRHATASPGSSPRSKQLKADDMPLPLDQLIAIPLTEKVPKPSITVQTHLMRSIYISPFVPTTETSDIVNHLKSNDDLKHIIPGIVCTKLVKKNRRVSFVSFKLDVPRHHYDIVVNPAIWPSNGTNKMTINEFIDKRAAHGHESTGKNSNPFSGPSNTQRHVKNHRLTKNANAKGAKGAKRRQSAPVTSNYIGTQQTQRPNFRHRCQKLCCDNPRPQYNNCHDRYGGNRFAHRPRFQN